MYGDFSSNTVHQRAVPRPADQHLELVHKVDPGNGRRVSAQSGPRPVLLHPPEPHRVVAAPAEHGIAAAVPATAQHSAVVLLLPDRPRFDPVARVVLVDRDRVIPRGHGQQIVS